MFFSNKVNSFPGLKMNAIVTIDFNSTNKAAYNYFPTLRLVSYSNRISNRIRCCAINKEGNAIVINDKRLTSKKAKQKQNKKKQHYIEGRNFS